MVQRGLHCHRQPLNMNCPHKTHRIRVIKAGEISADQPTIYVYHCSHWNEPVTAERQPEHVQRVLANHRRLDSYTGQSCDRCDAYTGEPNWATLLDEDPRQLTLAAAMPGCGRRAQAPTRDNRVSVIVVCYRIADTRLREFFTWNADTFRRSNATVYVVTDRKITLPDYARCVIYPENKLPLLNGQRVFSLSKTKNRGIAAALSDGCDVIISTDIDIWFPPATWADLAAVPANTAAIPVYLMARSWENRKSDFHPELGPTGTIAMTTDDWRQIHYDPRYIGYGAEDGKIVADIRRAGLNVDRRRPVCHIAHQRDTIQRNFRGRTDQHNPLFNPLRMRENMALNSSPTPDDPDAWYGAQPSLAGLQLLSIEANRECNLARDHAKCPSADADRYGDLDTSRPLADDDIMAAIREAMAMGFAGEIAWHYYNEPLLAWDRLRPLMTRIQAEQPAARFCLWTNGTQIGRAVPPEQLAVFSSIWISDYQPSEPGALAPGWSFLRQYVPNVHVLPGRLDDRKTLATNDCHGGCYRPMAELIIDHYGNGHLCCADYRGQVPLGNVHDVGLRGVAAKFLRLRQHIARPTLTADAPEICRRCKIRANQLPRFLPASRGR